MSILLIVRMVLSGSSYSEQANEIPLCAGFVSGNHQQAGWRRFHLTGLLSKKGAARIVVSAH